MSHRQCDQLEAYLARGLGLDEAAAFADHLPGCPACRHEVEAQTRIDALLRAAADRLDPPPADLLPKVEDRIARHRRRERLAWAAGLCAAAVVLLAVGGWVIGRNLWPDGGSPNVAQQDPSSTAEQLSAGPPLHRTRAEVVMVDPNAAIVVPLESKNPNVTIVWIYPAVRPPEGPSGPESD